MSEEYSEPCQRSKMECFLKLVNAKKLLTYFAKCFTLNVLQGSKYSSGCLNLFIFLKTIQLDAKEAVW